MPTSESGQTTEFLLWEEQWFHSSSPPFQDVIVVRLINDQCLTWNPNRFLVRGTLHVRICRLPDGLVGRL